MHGSLRELGQKQTVDQGQDQNDYSIYLPLYSVLCTYLPVVHTYSVVVAHGPSQAWEIVNHGIAR